MDRTTRRELLAAAAGAAAVVAGCSGGDGGSGGAATPTGTPFEYEEQVETTLAKGDGWTHDLPEFSGRATLSYTAAIDPTAGFDVHVFTAGQADAYTGYLAGEEPSEAPYGESGLSRVGLDGFVEGSGVIEGGDYTLAVDYSDYAARPDAARVDESDPDEVELAVTVELSSGADIV